VQNGIATIALRPGMSLTAMSASPCRATDAPEAPRGTRCRPTARDAAALPGHDDMIKAFPANRSSSRSTYAFCRVNERLS
jgi:hypothetical protein